MIKRNLKTLIFTTVICLVPMIAGLILWNKLPDTIATHWDMNGVANGWSSKLFAVAGLPLFLAVMHWVCVLATLADPKKHNISDKMFTLVLWICPVISILCGGFITLGTALGMMVHVEVVIPLFVGIVFMIIGNYLPKCKQSYTMGIKLPWTLSSTENWNRTHRLAGFLWMAGGALCILFTLLGMPVLLFALVVVMVAVPVLYSYLFYVRHEKNKIKQD